MKDKKLIFILILVGIVNILAIILCSYLFSIIKDKKRDIIISSEEARKISEKFENIKILESEILKIEEESKKIDQIFIQEEDIIKFIEILEKMGKDTKVSMELNTAKVEIVPIFQFNLSGTIERIYQYFVLLENLPYQILIEDVYIYKEGFLGESKVNNWKAGFRIKILSFSPKNN